jgi:hypothetical protein
MKGKKVRTTDAGRKRIKKSPATSSSPSESSLQEVGTLIFILVTVQRVPNSCLKKSFLDLLQTIILCRPTKDRRRHSLIRRRSFPFLLWRAGMKVDVKETAPAIIKKRKEEEITMKSHGGFLISSISSS